MQPTNIYTQYLQSALASWRERNQWADGIAFDSFPSKYRDAIELAAWINMNRERL